MISGVDYQHFFTHQYTQEQPFLLASAYSPTFRTSPRPAHASAHVPTPQLQRYTSPHPNTPQPRVVHFLGRFILQPRIVRQTLVNQNNPVTLYVPIFHFHATAQLFITPQPRVLCLTSCPTSHASHKIRPHACVPHHAQRTPQPMFQRPSSNAIPRHTPTHHNLELYTFWDALFYNLGLYAKRLSTRTIPSPSTFPFSTSTLRHSFSSRHNPELCAVSHITPHVLRSIVSSHTTTLGCTLRPTTQ